MNDMSSEKEECEVTLLLQSTQSQDNPPPASSERKPLTLTESCFILIAMSLGTGILTMPFTVLQLGWLPWILATAFTMILQCACVYLLSISIQHTLEEKAVRWDMVRDPYQVASEQAGGPVLRKICVIFMYLTNMSIAAAFILLVATILKYVIPVDSGFLTDTNVTRVWTLIIVSLITPVMFLGTYTELKAPSLIAIIASSLGVILIVTNCITWVNHGTNVAVSRKVKAAENAVIPLGVIIFANTGPILTLPNVLVLAARPHKLTRSIITCYLFLFCMILVAGLAPYFLLGQNLLPSITSTFSDVIKTGKIGGSFKVLAIVIQVAMLVHLSVAIVLGMNPCFLHMEELLCVPHEMCWKRVGVRTLFMLAIGSVCILIPKFDFVMSLTGGVLLTFFGMMLPLIVYLKLFALSTMQRIAAYLVLILLVIFVVSNFVAGIIKYVVDS